MFLNVEELFEVSNDLLKEFHRLDEINMGEVFSKQNMVLFFVHRRRQVQTLTLFSNALYRHTVIIVGSTNDHSQPLLRCLI